MATDIDVMLRLQADYADAERGMDRVGTAARSMADDVQRAARESEDASGRIDRVTDAADAQATRMSTLAGALGDVAGGLGLIGLGGFSDELEAAAPALMLVAGASDLAAVSGELLSGSNIKATITTKAKLVAEKAAAAGSKAMAAATWALNAAMNANPIGLVVAAVVALVAILVIAYKRSDRVRAIVNAVGQVGRRAIGWVVDKVTDLAKWVGSKVPAAMAKTRTAAVTAFRLATTPARLLVGVVRDVASWVGDKVPAAANAARDTAVRAWRLITAPARTLLGVVKDIKDWVGDKLGTAADNAKTVVVNGIDAIKAPFQAVLDLVKDLVGWIDKIKIPSLGDLNPFGRGGLPDLNPFSRTTTTTDPYPAGITEVFNITVNGALDAEAVAAQIEAMLRGRARRLGRPVLP